MKIQSNYGGLYSQTIKLNAFGEVVEVIDGENNTIKYEYDGLGQQIAVYDGYSKPTKYEYTIRGRKTTVIDGNENKYQYNYDEFGIGGEVMIGLNGIKLGFDLRMGAGIQIT